MKKRRFSWKRSFSREMKLKLVIEGFSREGGIFRGLSRNSPSTAKARTFN